jgi:hypothetical protein
MTSTSDVPPDQAAIETLCEIEREALSFETDDAIARRLRAVGAELRQRGLPTLAREVANLAEILDPRDG